MAIINGGDITEVKQVSSFPSGASEGDIVYHTGLQALFVNVTDTGDTTEISTWEIASSKTIITSVLTTATTNCDSISGTIYRTVKWAVSLTDITGAKYAAVEILANHDGTDVVFNESSIFGDAIDYAIDVQISGGNILLKVTNNEVNSLTVSVLRFSLL